MFGNHPRKLWPRARSPRFLTVTRRGAGRSWLRARVVVPLALLLAGIAGVSGYHHWLYPFGHRVGCMPNTLGALSYYAREHQGWYPRDGATPLVCLQAFYPKYLGAELAGITGDRGEVLRRLERQQSIDDTVSSWMYFPELRFDDDPEIALIWERRGGVTVNGHRDDGHAVGFVDGSVRQISSGEWPDFTRRQAELRQRVLSTRNSGQAAQKQAE